MIESSKPVDECECKLIDLTEEVDLEVLIHILGDMIKTEEFDHGSD